MQSILIKDTTREERIRIVNQSLQVCGQTWMSMGHEAVGHWFNEEVKENLSLLDEVEQAAKTVKGSERSWQRAGHEYTLWMDGEEVMVRANQLEFSGDEMEEGMSYYDEESLSLCGVEDFLQVVNAYREFMKQR